MIALNKIFKIAQAKKYSAAVLTYENATYYSWSPHIWIQKYTVPTKDIKLGTGLYLPHKNEKGYYVSLGDTFLCEYKINAYTPKIIKRMSFLLLDSRKNPHRYGIEEW